MKRRIIFDDLQVKRLSKQGRIIVLTGARQTGKTTVAHHCFADYNYLAIDDPVQRNDFLKLTSPQWHTFYPNAVLDEVQKEPALIDSIKATHDRFIDTRYLLLGSSQFLLMEKVKESLAGRCIIMEIYPLALPELMTKRFDDMLEQSFFAQYVTRKRDTDAICPSFSLDAQYTAKKKAYDFYLNYGGYPALTDEELTGEERDEWLKMYVRTFLERDIRDLASFRDLTPFMKLQKYLAHTTGALTNYSSIAKETGVSVPTVQRYLRYMEMSYQIVELPAWAANSLKKLVKAPKVHFLDNGVLRAILQKKGALTGNEFESAIVAEIYKQIKIYKLPLTCYHFRTQDGREIDLLLEAENYYIAIEIKMSEHINHTDARHLRNLQSILDKPIRHSFILSNDVRYYSLNDNITAIHAAAFLC
ncbi:MAG: ATP-binding protein [Prevotellaceae bacterium]|jgi:predicted AAA+ superfamily ATPase|nr:ATP-binding protein [Prevotellaceae bacterium]